MRLFAATRILPLTLLGAALGLTPPAAAQQMPASKASYPAGPTFNQAGSDAQAVALADHVMQQMGGYKAWQKAHYLAWDFFGGQYQIWDKYTGDFHWEKDDLVVNYNLNTKQGHAYRAGQDISSTEEGQKLLAGMYPTWANNSWWLVMPFKMKDSGVTLKYKGEEKTGAGAPADVVQLTFNDVGVTPDNRYLLYVNRATGLLDEWAYFPKATDAAPAFRRRWADYQSHDGLLLAADRSDGKDGRGLGHIAAVQTVPAGLMQCPTPVTKL